MMPIVVIVGATSTGKTSLALELAKAFDGEILSADSRQVFKYMDIGTGKIPINRPKSFIKRDKYWEVEGIKIHGYDLTQPMEYFSAADYIDFAIPKAKDILKNNKRLFIVGGTGFYIDLLTGRASPSGIPPNFELRKDLEKLSASELYEKLVALNPEKAVSVDKHNPVRLIRAIEIETSTDTPKDSFNYLYNTTTIGLTTDRDGLYKKVDNWLDSVWHAGVVDETKDLIARGYKDTLPLKGVVYKEAIDFLENNLTNEEAIQKSKFSLHAYIRRQQTWFKRNSDITWYDISKPNYFESIYKEIKTVYDQNNG